MKVRTVRCDLPDTRLNDLQIEDSEPQPLSVGSPRDEAGRLVWKRCDFPRRASIPLADVKLRVDREGDLLIIRRRVNVVGSQLSEPARGPTGKRHQPVREWTRSDIASDDQLRPARRNIIQAGIRERSGHSDRFPAA